MPIAGVKSSTASVVLKSSEASEDGAAHDGALGQARDTKNTYVISGMADMSPEEYQAALAQSVIDRANEQRYAGKARGNKLAHDYMANLSGNTDTSANIFGENSGSSDAQE